MPDRPRTLMNLIKDNTKALEQISEGMKGYATPHIIIVMGRLCVGSGLTQSPTTGQGAALLQRANNETEFGNLDTDNH